MLLNVNKKFIAAVIMIILLLSLALDFSSVYAGYEPTSDINQMYETSIIGKLFPELSKLSAPSWVKSGLRVYYNSFSGTITETSTNYSSLSSYPIIKSNSIKNPVEFLVQNDLITVNNDISWIKSTILSDIVLNVLQETNLKSASSMGPFWINPKVLTSSESSVLTNFTVSKIDFILAGITYKAFRIDYKENLDNSPHYTWVIDSETGLLLYISYRTRKDSTGQTSILVSQYSSRSQRSTTIPYTLLKGVTVGKGYRYVGTTKNIFFNGVTRQNPLVITATVISLGTNWTEFEIRRYLSDQVQPLASKIVMGPGSAVGGFWMPAAILASLKVGDIIDPYDRINGVSVEVTFVGSKFGNVPVVTIVSSHKLFKISWTYRISDGFLVQWTEEKVIDMINGTIQMNELTLESIKVN